MGWLIAIGILQLIVLCYITLCVKFLPSAPGVAGFVNLILGRLDAIKERLPEPYIDPYV